MYCLLHTHTHTHTHSLSLSLSLSQTHTHNADRKFLPPNPTGSFLNAALVSIYDSVSVDTVLVSIKASVMQINFLFRGIEVEARAGAAVGVVESGPSVDNAECVLSLAIISVVYVAVSVSNMGSSVVIISGKHELTQVSVRGGKSEIRRKYCNSLLMGLPVSSLTLLQSLYTAAGMVLQKCKYNHITSSFRILP